MKDRTVLDDLQDEYTRIWKQVKTAYKKLGFPYTADHCWNISLLEYAVRERYNIRLWGKEIGNNSPCEHNQHKEPYKIHSITIYGNCFNFDCSVKGYKEQVEEIKKVLTDLQRPAEWVIDILERDYQSSYKGTYPEKPAGLKTPIQLTIKDILP
ncbi:hypothetical protein F4Z99_04060 [Candidatus Poribacteria bacterium]|nr:hypothetical protein [Candidatus Poribacteria bacterium]